MQLEAFGYTVSNRHIGAALWQALRARGAHRAARARRACSRCSSRPSGASCASRMRPASERELRRRAGGRRRRRAFAGASRPPASPPAAMTMVRWRWSPTSAPIDRAARHCLRALRRRRSAWRCCRWPTAGYHRGLGARRRSAPRTCRRCEPASSASSCSAPSAGARARILRGRAARGLPAGAGARASEPPAHARGADRQCRAGAASGGGAGLQPRAARCGGAGRADRRARPIRARRRCWRNLPARRAADRRGMIALHRQPGDDCSAIARAGAIAARNLGLLLFDLSAAGQARAGARELWIRRRAAAPVARPAADRRAP